MPDFPEDGRVIVALDIGTSSARACIYGADGRPVEGCYHQEGRLSDLKTVQAARGETVEPGLRRHARYREALARQRQLDERV